MVEIAIQSKRPRQRTETCPSAQSGLVHRLPLALLVAVFLVGCPVPDHDQDMPLARAAPVGKQWPEADVLFRQEPRWLGSDAAYSIPLGDERTLWLFGDTFIATSDAHRRDESVMISNTIAIQDGLDPVTAAIRFAWREPSPATSRADLLPREVGLGPQAFLPDDGEIRYWPAHGVAAHGSVLVFWMRVAPSSEGLGFSIEGTRATLIEPTGDDPLAWPILDVELDGPPRIMVATMGAAVRDGWLYALSTSEAEHHAFLVRWPLEQAMQGELDPASWWTERGWSSGVAPIPLFDDGAPEGSLHFDEKRGEWVSVQATGFGGADLDIRTAAAPEGPWSPRRFFFRPPESDRPHTLVYAAKAHPQLAADGLAVTYAQNADDFDMLVRDSAVYWPRFVRVAWR